MTHRTTQFRTVTRLGATEWKRTCACGLSIQHPDPQVVTALFKAGHAFDLGMDVSSARFEEWRDQPETAAAR